MAHLKIGKENNNYYGDTTWYLFYKNEILFGVNGLFKKFSFEFRLNTWEYHLWLGGSSVVGGFLLGPIFVQWFKK